VIDLHTHLVPGVDDGPSEMAGSIALASQACAMGITVALATPHVRPRSFREEWSYMTEQHGRLRDALREERLPLETRLAGEILFEPGLEDLVSERCLSIDGEGSYYLVEVSMREEPIGALESFRSLVSVGKVPLLAHPERVSAFLDQPERLDDFLGAGVLLQVNAGSLLGRHRTGTQALAEFLVSTGRAHVVASDAHDTERRPFLLEQARAAIAANAGEARARALVLDNPRALLRGDALPAAAAVPSSAASADWPRRERPRSWLERFGRRMRGAM
jgi:protein-tyrosine phosphatase